MYSKTEKTERVNCILCEDKSCATARLNESQLVLLTAHSHDSYVKKGEVIVRSGSPASHIIFLRSGLVKEHITGINNKVQITQIIKRHSYLGLHSLFGDKINHFSYSALVNLQICYIDINIFKQFVRENGDFAFELLVYMSQESLHNYHWSINQNQKKTHGRFADVLLYLSEHVFNSTCFELPLTHNELAQLTGVSRENTARILSKFKAERIIDLSGKKIEILKSDLLKTISKNG